MQSAVSWKEFLRGETEGWEGLFIRHGRMDANLMHGKNIFIFKSGWKRSKRPELIGRFTCTAKETITRSFPGIISVAVLQSLFLCTKGRNLYMRKLPPIAV